MEITGMKIKLRIAVAMDRKGGWVAFGSDDVTDDEAMNECAMNLRNPRPAGFVEATMPFPESLTVEGTVVAEGTTE